MGNPVLGFEFAGLVVPPIDGALGKKEEGKEHAQEAGDREKHQAEGGNSEGGAVPAPSGGEGDGQQQGEASCGDDHAVQNAVPLFEDARPGFHFLVEMEDRGPAAVEGAGTPAERDEEYGVEQPGSAEEGRGDAGPEPAAGGGGMGKGGHSGRQGKKMAERAVAEPGRNTCSGN